MKNNLKIWQHQLSLLKSTELRLKRFLLLIIALAFVFPAFSKEKPFTLEPVKDGVLIGTGVLLSGGDLILDNVLKVNRCEYNGEIYNKDNTNAFDRFFMHSYSESRDKIADLTMAASMATGFGFPFVSLVFEKDEEWLTAFSMYAETLLIANGFKETLKLCVNRARPYMYYDSETFPEEDLEDGDFVNSFPSGHSTMAFACATYTSYVFSKYYPDSKWKIPVIAASYGLAAGTAALRVSSGNHFMTDVLFGAVTGSAIGFLVPWLHTFNENHDLKLALYGNGLSFKLDI
ncbi:MAG: phosphatase PAP2 family protein [Treponema sp.]|nr:phosphatase PAP2 family protein [Candidatus Treponema equifaecale]